MDFYYGAQYAVEDGVLALLSGLFSGFPSFALSIATYVLSALGLYTIAKRRGISKPWLSWIPVVNIWIMGSLSDQYRYVVRGENKSKRKILLPLNIAAAVLGTGLTVCVVVLLGVAIAALVLDGGGSLLMAMMGKTTEIDPAAMLHAVEGPMIKMLIMLAVLLCVSIPLAVIRFMALYDVYTSCDPQNNVAYLVLSILIPVTEPFFLFFARQKDYGMPPRRQEYAYVPPQPQNWQQPPQQPQRRPPQPPQEPWNGQQKDYL